MGEVFLLRKKENVHTFEAGNSPRPNLPRHLVGGRYGVRRSAKLLDTTPACVALYVALFSGVTLSFAGASLLRTSLLLVCVAAFFCLALLSSQ
jgi:hypothetical protein